ncbi:lipase [Pseudomonas aeruginosa VRFPA09]|nr:lipase [Pseudomonas aeruginosa VRFPA09]
MSADPQARESIAIRILWMLLFVLVWQVAELLLGAVVVIQLVYRLIYGAPNGSLMAFGDSLSQYLAQIGRFGTFHSDEKPWPFADWPSARAAEGEAAHRPLRARPADRRAGARGTGPGRAGRHRALVDPRRRSARGARFPRRAQRAQSPAGQPPAPGRSAGRSAGAWQPA